MVDDLPFPPLGSRHPERRHADAGGGALRVAVGADRRGVARRCRCRPARGPRRGRSRRVPGDDCDPHQARRGADGDPGAGRRAVDGDRGPCRHPRAVQQRAGGGAAGRHPRRRQAARHGARPLERVRRVVARGRRGRAQAQSRARPQADAALVRDGGRDGRGSEPAVARHRQRGAAHRSDDRRTRRGAAGGVDGALQLGQRMPGAPAALVQAVRGAEEAQQKSNAARDAVYDRLDGSGTPVISPADWTAQCNAPFEAIMRIPETTATLLERYAGEITARARAQLVLDALGLAAAVLLSAFSMVIVRRRFAIPIRNLTAAIMHLARRDYGKPVRETGHADELGRMAATLEALRLNAREVERLSGESIASKEARLKQVGALEEYCREFDTAIRRTLSAVTAAAGHMTRTANTMSSIAEKTADRSTVVAAASTEASVNVQTVAAAAEELAKSIAEISQQVAQ